MSEEDKIRTLDYTSSNEGFKDLIMKNYERFFEEKIIHNGFKKHSREIGEHTVTQNVRVSFNL